MLTQMRLRELLDYDPMTGTFTWRRQAHVKDGPTLGVRNRWAGQVAGATTIQGYRIINVDGERLRACRLAWLYMTGNWPVEHVDHINGNSLDDKWINLRECTRSENMSNAKLLRLNNTSGARGVDWNKRLGKWHARVKFEGQLHHCGYFDNFDDAVKARDTKAAQIHGAFAKLNTMTPKEYN